MELNNPLDIARCSPAPRGSPGDGATPCLVPVSFVRHRVGTGAPAIPPGQNLQLPRQRHPELWHWGDSQFSCDSPLRDAEIGNRTQRQDMHVIQ